MSIEKHTSKEKNLLCSTNSLIVNQILTKSCLPSKLPKLKNRMKMNKVTQKHKYGNLITSISVAHKRVCIIIKTVT